MPPKLAVVIADDDLPSSLGQLAASLCDSNFALTSSGKPLSLASRKRPGSASSQGKPKLPLIVGKLMRNQMKVSEAMDSHVRRVLLRISAGQVVNTLRLNHSSHFFARAAMHVARDA
ncbi:hypothetical protein JHK85_053314 [Glycine max]|nr:hypothetical protein JHK87_052538 [Glycine soja]KAG4926828.1 hypothetical protein JHK85_053314 [Glycine max]